MNKNSVFFHFYVNQNQPKSQILFHRNSSPHDLYTMTLGIYTVGFCKHYFCRVIVFLMISEATWDCCHHHTSTTNVFSRLLKLLLLRHLLAAAAASTLHPQSKFCFPGAQPCVLLQSSKLLKEKLKGLHGSSLGCLLLLCLRTDSWLVDNSCSEHKEVAVRGGTQWFQMTKNLPK